MSQLKVNSIIPVSGVPTGGGGGIIQIKQTVKTDAFSTSSTSFVDVTGLSVAITPTSSSSKILVSCCVALGPHENSFAYAQLLRGSTNIGQADAAGNRARPTFMAYQAFRTTMIMQPFEFLDSPNTTSATTYKIQLRAATVDSAFVNRTQEDDDGVNVEPRCSSVITAMEVSA